MAMAQGRSGCLPAFFGSSWRLADKAFAARDLFLGEQDEEMDQLYKWRSIIGSVIILCVAFRYHHFSGIPETFYAVLQSVEWTIDFAMLSIVPAAAAVVLYTLPGKRRDALIQMRYPAMAFGTWTLISVGLALFFRLQTGAFRNQNSVAVGLLMSIMTLVLLLWLAAFMLRMTYQMATGMFRLGDAHPLLPPAVTVLAAWCLAVKGLLAGGGSGGEPAALAVILLIGGPLSLTALAALEIERLKRRFPDDFPFRRGPLSPMPKDAFSPW